MNCNAIIFDLDGTLLNTLEDIADSANAALNKLGFPQHGLDAYKSFVGEGIENLVRRALPENKLEEALVVECVALMRDEYSKRWANKTRVYKEIPEMLDALTTQGIKMAILSNKPDDFTKEMVAVYLAKWQFAIIQGEKPQVPKKPDPVAALAIAQLLKIPPQKFLFLGDSGVDMKTGVAAGMYAVGVLWGFRTASELSAGGAKILLENPTDLLRIL